MFAERRVIPLSALLQSIRWARKTHAKPKSTNAHWAVHNRAKRASTNKATYLSLKSDFGKGVWPFLEAYACLEISRERKVQVLESFEILLCEDLQRIELEEEVVLRAWDESVSDCEVLKVEETSSPLVSKQFLLIPLLHCKMSFLAMEG